MTTDSIAKLFHKDNLAVLVQALNARSNELAENLEWVGDSNTAAPLMFEMKMIERTFEGLRAEYGHSYIDSILSNKAQVGDFIKTKEMQAPVRVIAASVDNGYELEDGSVVADSDITFDNVLLESEVL